jgi:hypothetical protein
VLIAAWLALQRFTATSPPRVTSCMSASCTCPTDTLPPSVDTATPQKRLGMETVSLLLLLLLWLHSTASTMRPPGSSCIRKALLLLVSLL